MDLRSLRRLGLSLLIMFVLLTTVISGCSLFERGKKTSEEPDSDEPQSRQETSQAIKPEDIDLDELKKLQQDLESANSSVSEAESIDSSLDSAIKSSTK